MKIEIPQIFNNYNIIAGITLANTDLYKPYGFSITPAQIYDSETIAKMKNDLATELGVTVDDLIFQKQTHSNSIRIVDNYYTYNDNDGMITQLKNKLLVISLADCCGILIYDKKLNIIAAIHSGWRGSAQNITGKAINILKEEYKSDPKDLICFLTPSASVLNYEIGRELLHYLGDFTINRDGKLYFDNKEMIKHQLLAAGVILNNIEISEVCTIENSNYHSFRRDNNLSGRMAAYIGMKI